jgi:hypothetical protein
MDDDLDEEQQRKRRAGVGIEIELNDRPQQRAENDQPERPQRPANDRPQWQRNWDDWEMNVGGETVAVLVSVDPSWAADGIRMPNEGAWQSHVVTKDLPAHGWDKVDFTSLEAGKADLEKWWDYARKGEAYTPVSREAIERDPWAAVALDLPANVDPALLFLVADTARNLQFTLRDRAFEATTPEQTELWDRFADQAAERHKEAVTVIRGLSADTPMSKEAIDEDQWRAFVDSLPADQVRQDIRAEAEERDTIALAEAIDDDRRRHRDDPDAVRESAREDRFSSDRIDEVRQSREETAEPLYDRYTGERLDEAGQEHEAGHDLGGGGRGRSLFP